MIKVFRHRKQQLMLKLIRKADFNQCIKMCLLSGVSVQCSGIPPAGGSSLRNSETDAGVPHACLFRIIFNKMYTCLI